MASKEEESIRPRLDPAEDDSSDEVQDFLLLSRKWKSKVPASSSSSSSTALRRGEKDFEPHGTNLQSSALAASRAAMHDAISAPRWHRPGADPVARLNLTYLPSPDAPPPPSSSFSPALSPPAQPPFPPPSIQSTSSASRRPRPLFSIDVMVENPRGMHFRTAGRADRSGAVHLLPEEALYLLERGSLDLRWGRIGTSMGSTSVSALGGGGNEGGGSRDLGKTGAGGTGESGSRSGSESTNGHGEGEPVDAEEAATEQEEKGLEEMGERDEGREGKDKGEEEGREGEGEERKGEREAEKQPMEGLPVSLQSAYAIFVGNGCVSLERYTVYASLRRSGFIVYRSSGWARSPRPPPRDHESALSPVRPSWPTALALKLLEAIGFLKPLEWRPIVPNGWYRSYEDQIYRRLSIVQWHDPSVAEDKVMVHQEAEEEDGSVELPPSFPSCCYNVWKPKPSFRKSSPGEPDFRVAVIDAQEQPVLSLQQIDALFNTVPLSPPPASPNGPPNAQMYQRLKHGWKNVILAIVDNGIVSYLRFSDAAFGKEKLYEHNKQFLSGNKEGRGGGRPKNSGQRGNPKK